jgi:hypothetical protein
MSGHAGNEQRHGQMYPENRWHETVQAHASLWGGPKPFDARQQACSTSSTLYEPQGCHSRADRQHQRERDRLEQSCQIDGWFWPAVEPFDVGLDRT